MIQRPLGEQGADVAWRLKHVLSCSLDVNMCRPHHRRSVTRCCDEHYQNAPVNVCRTSAGAAFHLRSRKYLLGRVPGIFTPQWSATPPAGLPPTYVMYDYCTCPTAVTKNRPPQINGVPELLFSGAKANTHQRRRFPREIEAKNGDTRASGWNPSVQKTCTEVS